MATRSIPHRWKYDVFVSFRGEDIRKNFMDHMFNDFKRKGIHAFRDDNDLPRGEYISPQLYKAIEESRFLIVIFSKHYASSSWCLRELVKILECKKIENPKHEFRIIFYDVKPNVVRKQTGSYADQAFAQHDVLNRAEVDKWKEALSVAADLSGFELQEMTNGYEFKFIDNISKEILNVISDGPLNVAENLVSVDARVRELNLLRFVGSDKVHMIGICGFSGIGKTTLAKAIYNSMYTYFEGRCFCCDVQGVTKRQGLTQVQMQMFVKILKTENLKISSVSEGTKVIKQRMACKPILLVLDDVNDLEQLEALAGSPDWFFRGSLIIFTGKDKQLLRSHKVDELYEMKTLDYYKALELFSLNAFGKRHPTEVFEEFASEIVKYLNGHPLALKVIGRSLYEKSVDFWKSKLERLQTYPNSEIVQKLRPSFDSLASDEKRMFLDIACAFIGENKDFAASVLHSSQCSANAIIEVLADKFLITVFGDCLQMHELIQSMAWEITREELNMPGKQRRLCISSALSEKKVEMTEAIEVLVLLLRKSSQEVHIDANSFALMKNLRILKIYAEKELDQKEELKGYNVKYSGSLDILSNELSFFCWHGCPFKYLPSDFYPENIVAIDLSYSNIKQLWTTPKCLRRLKIMKLRHCCNLTTTPDFSEITNLEELDLEGCVNLVTVHPSIGMLKRLAVLNMRDCRRARSIPSKVEMDSLQVLNRWGCLNDSLKPFGQDAGLQSLVIWNQQHPQRSVSLAGLHMLKSLNFSYCNLYEVPESIGGLSCLKKLNLKGNNLLEVPESIGGLSCLKKLNLRGNNLLEVPVSIGGLSCLKKLDLGGNNLLEVPESIGGLSFLEDLYLSWNNFTSLPGSLSQLSNLQDLYVNGCKKLEVLSEVPPSIRIISACDCTSLREVPGSSKHPFRNRYNYFFNCPKLFKNVTIDSEGSISKTECLDSSITSQGSIHQLSAFLGYAGLQADRCEFFSRAIADYYDLDIMYHGNSIPEWFTNRSTGNHVKVELPSYWCFNKFRGYGFCVVFKRKKHHKFIRYSAKNFDGASMIGGYCVEREVLGIQDSYMIWLHYTKRDTQEWKEAKNFVTFSFQDNELMCNEGVEVKECGVRLICDEDIEQEADVSMLQGLPTPTTQHGVMLSLRGAENRLLEWSCYPN